MVPISANATQQTETSATSSEVVGMCNSYFRETYALIEVAHVGPGIRRLLHQARNGATDVEVRAAIEAAESSQGR